MPIDPQAKMARYRAKREKAIGRYPSTPKTNVRKRVTKVERAIIAEVVDAAPNNLPSREQIAGLATTLNRPVATIASVVDAAREQLERNALDYVKLHLEVAQRNKDSDPDVSRKAAEFAIKNIAHASADRIHRIVDKEDSAASAPTIQIGIALGGLPSHARATTLPHKVHDE